MDLIEAIDLISVLPPIPEWYIPESKTIENEIKKLKNRYHHSAKWAKHLLHHAPEPTDEDPLIEYHYRLGLYLKASLDLVQATHNILSKIEPEWQKYDAYQIWYAWIWSESLLTLNVTGIYSLIHLGVAAPKITSKTDIVSIQSKIWQHFDIDNNPVNKKYEIIEIKPEEFEDFTKFHFKKYVLSRAFNLARENENFRKLHYNPYLKFEKTFNGFIDKDKTMQVTYLLSETETFTTAKYARPPLKFLAEAAKETREKRRKRDRDKRMGLLQELYKNKK